MNPKKRLDELTDMLNRYAKKYYTEDISEVSDYEYDMLSRELQALEAEYPDLRRADSPSLRVGGSIAEGFEPVVHEVPMESLQDAFSKEELLDFDRRVKEKFPNTLLLFVTPPSAEELRKRLEGRGTETQEVIDGRMKRAIEEAEYMDQYDYLVVNDELDVCVEEMHHLIQGEHERCFRNQTFIEHMKRELKGE